MKKDERSNSSFEVFLKCFFNQFQKIEDSVVSVFE